MAQEEKADKPEEAEERSALSEPLEGLYEAALTRRLRDALAAEGLKPKQTADREDAGTAERFSDELLASLLERTCARAVRSALADVLERSRRDEAAALANRVLAAAGADGADLILEPPTLLLAADRPAPGMGQGTDYGTRSERRPITSFTRGALFAAEKGAPALADELGREIDTAERIDLLVSFVRYSGWRVLRPSLEAFAKRGGRLRLVTTTYIGATEAKAVDEIAQLPNAEVWVSYQSQSSRLHAKAYLFHRPHGLSTAYVGSANISRAALEDGLEWMVKATEAEQPALFERMASMFEGYAEGDAEFRRYEPGRGLGELEDALEAARRHGGGRGEVLAMITKLALEPFPFQAEILEKLAAARANRGETRSLVVAATGTGKTMIAAFDYRRWREARRRAGLTSRLLFLVHRQEILQQALASFRAVLRDANFGELCVGGRVPAAWDHVFMSVQSMTAKSVEAFAPDQFDYVVIDEFHHACAPTYRAILEHLKPACLLGLTATPFRGDGQNLLSWFGGRITAELPLSDAIDRLLLSPFEYWMVTDPVSLEAVKWSRGGYDEKALEAAFLSGQAAQSRDRAILDAVERYLPDLAGVKGLGFCVTVAHAEHMTALFNRCGIASRCVHGGTPKTEREQAPAELEAGRIRFIFTVDVYNEGVDIPSVNTVLFLRPTDSPVVFLQQLGRGLRRADGKASLLVLDFVGAANKKFSYEAKLRALMSGGSVREALEQRSFARFLPAGCTLQFESVAWQSVLENVRLRRSSAEAFTQDALDWLRGLPDDAVSLKAFLIHARRTLADWRRYACRSGARFFGDLLHDAAPDRFPARPASLASVSSAMLSRVLRLNGRRAILRLLVDFERGGGWAARSDALKRDWRLLAAAWFERDSAKAAGERLGEALFETLAAEPWLKRELRWILEADADAVDFLSPETPLEARAPIELGAEYGARPVLAMLGDAKAFDFREGVKHLGDADGPGSIDLFFVTILKDAPSFTETTSYDDYAMNERRFHWQSQSRTASASPTGRRYQKIGFGSEDPQGHLFVRREKADETGNSLPFVYLGRVAFISSRGERPMSIQWALENPLSARLLDAFRK